MMEIKDWERNRGVVVVGTRMGRVRRREQCGIIMMAKEDSDGHVGMWLWHRNRKLMVIHLCVL